MLKRSLVLLYLVFAVLGCRENEVHEEKNFRVYVATDESSLKYSIQILVRDYNSRIGFEALTVVDSKAESNSLIHFRKGLINDGRKLGLGQWVATQKSVAGGTFGEEQVTTIEYGMDIVFDVDNFLAKAAYAQDPDSDEYKHLLHLFCHEVGHGMQMNHSDDISSVMYYSIPEKGARELNYNNYFSTIRNFLQDPASMRVNHMEAHDETQHKHETEY